MANGDVSPARRLWNYFLAWSSAFEASPYDDIANRLHAMEREVAQLRARQEQPRPMAD